MKANFSQVVRRSPSFAAPTTQYLVWYHGNAWGRSRDAGQDLGWPSFGWSLEGFGHFQAAAKADAGGLKSRHRVSGLRQSRTTRLCKREIDWLAVCASSEPGQWPRHCAWGDSQDLCNLVGLERWERRGPFGLRDVFLWSLEWRLEIEENENEGSGRLSHMISQMTAELITSPTSPEPALMPQKLGAHCPVPGAGCNELGPKKIAGPSERIECLRRSRPLKTDP